VAFDEGTKRAEQLLQGCPVSWVGGCELGGLPFDQEMLEDQGAVTAGEKARASFG